MTTTAGEAGIVTTFRQWSFAAHNTAVACCTKGDRFGARLATARAEVYALVADFARDQMSPDALAALLARSEVAHHLPIRPDALPLGGEDEASLEHVRAMAWGLCARTVDPSHQLVEKAW